METMRACAPENGTYEPLPYTEHFVQVDLPASEEDAGFPGEVNARRSGYRMFLREQKSR